MARVRRVPPLSSPVRQALIRYRIRDLMNGKDCHETFLSLWLVLQGLLYAAPTNTTGQAPAYRFVRELGGDPLLVLVFLPLGVVKVGCMLRPVIASVAIHKAALMMTIGICLFLTIMTWAALPWSAVPLTFGLVGMLACLTYLHLDRE